MVRPQLGARSEWRERRRRARRSHRRGRPAVPVLATRRPVLVRRGSDGQRLLATGRRPLIVGTTQIEAPIQNDFPPTRRRSATGPSHSSAARRPKRDDVLAGIELAAATRGGCCSWETSVSLVPPELSAADRSSLEEAARLAPAVGPIGDSSDKRRLKAEPLGREPTVVARAQQLSSTRRVA
jgi:hypothetical protein